MAYAMTKQGSLDNCITYEFMCDTTADMNSIENRYRTIGSVAIVLSGESEGLEVYIANSNKEWVELSTASSEGGGSIGGGIEIGTSTDNPDTLILIDTESGATVEIPEIDDTITSEVDTWSSTKIAAEIANIATGASDWLASEGENGYIANKPGTHITGGATYTYLPTEIEIHEGDAWAATFNEIAITGEEETITVHLNGDSYALTKANPAILEVLNYEWAYLHNCNEEGDFIDENFLAIYAAKSVEEGTWVSIMWPFGAPNHVEIGIETSTDYYIPAADWTETDPSKSTYIANKPGSPTTVLGVHESITTEVYDYTHIVDHINGTISATVAEVTSPEAEKVRVTINGHKYIAEFIKSQNGYTYYGYNHNSSWGLVDDTDIGIEIFFSDDGTDNEVNVSVSENCTIDWVNAIENTSDVTIGIEMLDMMPGYVLAADWEENDPSKSTYIANKPDIAALEARIATLEARLSNS